MFPYILNIYKRSQIIYYKITKRFEKNEDIMNYRNAQDIFPENLLKQIQRYVSGETHNRRAFRKILSFV